MKVSVEKVPFISIKITDEKMKKKIYKTESHHDINDAVHIV